MRQAPLPPLCLLAGGRGVRLGSLTDDVPKPLVEVADRPFLDWVLVQVKEAGFERVVLCVGYKGSAIRSHVGDGGQFGLEVTYSDDGPQLVGTLGAVRQALPLLGDPVPVLYADTLLPIDLASVVRGHSPADARMTMTVLHNSGRWDTSNAVVGERRVIAYSKAPPPPGAEWIDYGFCVINRDVLAASHDSDLASVTSALAKENGVAAWPVTEPFHEIGTPQSLAATERWVRSTLR